MNYSETKGVQFAEATPSPLRIVEKFKAIRDLAAQDDLESVWNDASSIRKLAMEIQTFLGVLPDEDKESAVQVHGHGWGDGTCGPRSQKDH